MSDRQGPAKSSNDVRGRTSVVCFGCLASAKSQKRDESGRVGGSRSLPLCCSRAGSSETCLFVASQKSQCRMHRKGLWHRLRHCRHASTVTSSSPAKRINMHRGIGCLGFAIVVPVVVFGLSSSSRTKNVNSHMDRQGRVRHLCNCRSSLAPGFSTGEQLQGLRCSSEFNTTSFL